MKEERTKREEGRREIGGRIREKIIKGRAREGLEGMAVMISWVVWGRVGAAATASSGGGWPGTLGGPGSQLSGRPDAGGSCWRRLGQSMTPEAGRWKVDGGQWSGRWAGWAGHHLNSRTPRLICVFCVGQRRNRGRCDGIGCRRRQASWDLTTGGRVDPLVA